MPGITDLIGKLRHMMNKGAGETFNPATDSLEAIVDTLTPYLPAFLVPAVDTADNIRISDVVGNKADAAVYAASLVASLMAYAKGNITLANYIYNLANSVQTLTETGGTITTDGGAQDIYHVATPMGLFRPIAFKIDCSAMAAADVMHITVLERIVAGGGMVISDFVELSGVQAVPLKTIHLDPNRFGIEITIHETAGAHVAYPWAVIWES
jgi:hypothetical protein